MSCRVTELSCTVREPTMAGQPELDVALEHLNRAEIRVLEQGRRL